MSVPAPPPPTIPDPKMNPTAAADSLPQNQLETLRYKITQIMESINGLINTLNAPQPGGLASWPELMTKYNVLLSKTHSLGTSLSAPPTRKGQTSLKAIAPHPYATTTNQPPGMDTQQVEAMLEALLDGRRSQSVLKANIANVARLRLPRENTGPGVGFGGGGVTIGAGGASTGLGGGTSAMGVREGPMTAEELRAEQSRLDEVVRAHDARCARGVEAVRQLKDKYDWKLRLLFDDSDTEVEAVDSEVGTHREGSSEPGQQAGEDDEEDMVEIGVAPSRDKSPDIPMERETDPEEAMPTHTFIPAETSSDSESEEELPLARGMPNEIPPPMRANTGTNGDVGMDGDGSDSDGVEDVAPAFVPPVLLQYHNGLNGNEQPEPSPVSALENLWVIDP